MENKEDKLFADEVIPEKEKQQEKEQKYWKVLVVDDEEDVHIMTRLALEDFSFEDKKVDVISAYSGEEAKRLIKNNPDTALIILDVVMEEEDSGLKFVKFLREELKNSQVRVILRTGQPGYSPERSVIINFDINDYKEKTDLTAVKFFTTVVMALRSFRDLENIESDRKAMENHAIAAERFVPRDFLKLLSKESISHVELGDNVEQEMAILFLDIRSFTTIASRMTLKETFDFINDVLSYFEPVIIQNQGFIDKYIGDAIMALFCGSPDPAIRAGVGLFKMQDKYNKKNHIAPIQIGIGINAGLVIVGSIGFHDRMECTVISDVVNVAARLEKLNVLYGTRLLISDDVMQRMEKPDNFKYRILGDIMVKGKTKAIKVFEVLDAEPNEIAQLKWETKAEFEEGLELYQAGKFDQAAVHFIQVLEKIPTDQVAKFYTEECARKSPSLD